MRVLCVAEKPLIAKLVAHTLGGGKVTVRSTKNKYVKNYDFSFQFLPGRTSAVTMTLVLGHLTEMQFPLQYDWGKCVPGKLYLAEVVESVSASLKAVAENIQKEARNADQLMVWTDCDREGEYIGYEIVKTASVSNPRLTVDSVWRAQFSHLARQHVMAAALKPGQLEKRSIEAVATRIELDLRTGYSFTRFITDTMKLRFGKDTVGKVVLYGLCQFPTLGFVVDRYRRVKSFVAEPFWHLEVETRTEGVKTTYAWQRHRVFDRAFATLLYEQCMRQEPNDVATVVDLSSKPTSNRRPLPLTTVLMQKDCARFFKLSALAALNAAELLYTKGFISYPRTETDTFPKGMDLRLLVQAQTQLNEWGSYASDLLALQNGRRFQQPRSGNKDDKAHPPIHPVVFTDGGQLKGPERKVYEYVVRRFLACCSDDARGTQALVTLQWGSERFSATGLIVLERNYLDVYPYVKWELLKQLPRFTPNQQVKLLRAELLEGKTSPPQHMTEPELIALMDANGIGTDATIADHIDKVVEREYVVKVAAGRGAKAQALLVPSELGMALVEAFDRMLDSVSLTKPWLRRQLEENLTAIVGGQRNRADVLAEEITRFREVFAESNRKQAMLIEAYQQVVLENRQT